MYKVYAGVYEYGVELTPDQDKLEHKDYNIYIKSYVCILVKDFFCVLVNDTYSCRG